MLGRVLNLCAYNSMTLSKGRDTEISEVMHNVDIVMLPGTQLVANKDASDTEITATYRSWQLANHTHTTALADRSAAIHFWETVFSFTRGWSSVAKL